MCGSLQSRNHATSYVDVRLGRVMVLEDAYTIEPIVDLLMSKQGIKRYI